MPHHVAGMPLKPVLSTQRRALAGQIEVADRRPPCRLLPQPPDVRHADLVQRRRLPVNAQIGHQRADCRLAKVKMLGNSLLSQHLITPLKNCHD